MVKKLTITVSDEVYEGLYKHVGRRKISRYIDRLLYNRVNEAAVLEMYRQAAADPEREAEAREWDELGIGDGLEEHAGDEWPDAPG